MNDTIVKTEGTVLTVERIFNVPREKVWDAWTIKEIFEKWWGPHGWTTTCKEFDFREGGATVYGMKCEDESQEEWYGQTSWGKMLYSDIRPIECFIYTDYFCDADGNVSVDMVETKVEMKFELVEGGTKVISICSFVDEQALKTLIDMGMSEGLKQTWERLSNLLEK